jgi:hypothetical protein
MNAEPVEAPAPPGGEGQRLFGFYEKGAFGFFDLAGRIVIPACYDGGSPWASDFGHFSDGFAMVVRAGRSGFVDPSGRDLVCEDPSFSAAQPFSEGLAVVRGGPAGRQVAGFMDTTGRIVIEPREAFASVGIYPMDTSVTRFACGRALVAQRKDDGVASRYLGYLDRQGDWAIRGDFDFADDFSEGLATVKGGGGVGCIDPSGQWVIEPNHGWISTFVDGLAPFTRPGARQWGVINRTGEVVVEPVFEQMRPFCSGLAVVAGRPEPGSAQVAFGAIDRSGALVVPLAFQAMTWFHEGLAGVVAMGADGSGRASWGVIDRSGQYVIPPGLGYPFGFRDGLCRLRLSAREPRDTCYIDSTGRIVWKTLF